MHTLGHSFVPPALHAGGLRYHGMAPIISALAEAGAVEVASYHQTTCFEAACLFAQTEGIVPAPETSHAVKAAIDEARKNEGKVIVILFSGHGHFDLGAYDAYLAGQLEDYEYPREKIEEALRELPGVPE